MTAPASIVTADPDACARCAADIFATVLRDNPGALIALPAGRTPQPLYAALRKDYAAGLIGNAFTALQLDEYCGVPDDSPCRFGAQLEREILDPLGIPPNHRIGFRSAAPDPAAEAERVADLLRCHGLIDLAILGLGLNGHLGLNEPGSAPDAPTRVVRLHPETRAAQATAWGGPALVPELGITLGLAELSAARHVMVLVTGATKAAILNRALSGPVTPDLPASYLQTWPNVTVIADRTALSGTIQTIRPGGDTVLP